MSETLMAADPIAGEAQMKTYRGASIEELLPQVRADLGPEAVIVSRREGLIGGIGGFFQKKCIEIDARPGGPRIDVYDDGVTGREMPELNMSPEYDGLGSEFDALPVAEPPARPLGGPAAEPAAAAGPSSTATPQPTMAQPPEPAEAHPVRNDAATREGLATPAVQRLVGEAKPFADLLGEMTSGPASPAARAYAAAETALDPAAEPAVEPGAQTELLAEPAVEAEPAPEPRRVAALREGMVAAGLGTDLAADVVDAVVANVAPFATPSRLRTLVRNELSLRLPVAPAPGAGRRRLAVVGPAGTGKTAAVARVAAAHAAAGQDVACLTLEPADGGASLRAMLEGTGVKVEAIAYDELAVALLAESAQLVLIDTPAAAPSTGVTVESLGVTLRAASVDEIHLAVRAGTASPAAVEMFENLKGLEPNRILVSAAADTSYVGAALDVAIRTSLPIHYVAETVVELAPADPRDLSSRVVP
jgi:flagellar biosynthesis protein FlhF